MFHSSYLRAYIHICRLCTCLIRPGGHIHKCIGRRQSVYIHRGRRENPSNYVGKILLHVLTHSRLLIHQMSAHTHTHWVHTLGAIPLRQSERQRYEPVCAAMFVWLFGRRKSLWVRRRRRAARARSATARALLMNAIHGYLARLLLLSHLNSRMEVLGSPTRYLMKRCCDRCGAVSRRGKYYAVATCLCINIYIYKCSWGKGENSARCLGRGMLCGWLPIHISFKWVIRKDYW